MTLAVGAGGSSPRTRGTVGCAFRLFAFVRFIPAHAGNSDAAASPSSTSPVHPRARGEQQGAGLEAGGRRGSSPRTRGTEGARPDRSASHRFIPAHAGNRARRRSAAHPPPVHPRARGEQSHALRKAVSSTGSSPRTRGTVESLDADAVGSRFIPAHAGNRCHWVGKRSPDPVHPRARGEQSVAGS